MRARFCGVCSFSCFYIKIASSNFNFSGTWTPSFFEFTSKMSKFHENEHSPGLKYCVFSRIDRMFLWKTVLVNIIHNSPCLPVCNLYLCCCSWYGSPHIQKVASTNALTTSRKRPSCKPTRTFKISQHHIDHTYHLPLISLFAMPWCKGFNLSNWIIYNSSCSIF